MGGDERTHGVLQRYGWAMFHFLTWVMVIIVYVIYNIHTHIIHVYEIYFAEKALKIMTLERNMPKF